ncbi:integrase, catalytic region, zinc finger, CCHC-type containing protein [Tanacetum coccineum]
MHANDHHDNVLLANNNSLVYDNFALDRLKHDNDRLMELFISQDLVHTVVNSLAAINDYKSKEQSFVDEYEVNFKLQTELDKKNDMIEKVVYNELLKRYARELRPLDSNLASACKFVTQIQELLVYVSATCPSTKHVSDKLVAATPMNRTRKVRFAKLCETSNDNTYKQVKLQEKQTTNNSMLPSIGVSCSTKASGSKPRINTKNDRTPQTLCSNKKNNKVEDHPRIAKSSLNNLNLISKYVCRTNLTSGTYVLGGSRHMTRQRSQLINFVSKFLGTIGFENDQISKIIGYGDYQLGNVTISRVYYVEGLGHNFFSVGQFCDSNLEVAFQKHTCYIQNSDDVDLLSGSRDTNLYTISLDNMLKSFPICLLSKASKTKNNGTKFVNQTLRDYYENVRITHETSVARTLQQNGVVERQNRTLVEAANTMLIFSKAPLFLWSEGVSTTCYTQNRSLIRLWYNKAPYELLHDKKPDLSHFHVFGSLCYPTNNSEDLGKLKVKADIGIFVGYAPAKKAFRIYNKRT